MLKARRRADVLPDVKALTAEELAKLKKAGANDKSYWNTDGEDKSLVSKFRHEAKQYYYFGQGRRCCYCSIELHAHQASFDAEHILDQSTFPEFMFEPANLAVSCKVCNGQKGTKSVLAAVDRPITIPAAKADYCIVHPHLDEWDEYLEFDHIGRIRPIEGNEKGRHTIETCGIHNLNAARLSDNFNKHGALAEEVLRVVADRSAPLPKRLLQLKLLRRLADELEHAPAKAVVGLLEEELGAT